MSNQKDKEWNNVLKQGRIFFAENYLKLYHHNFFNFSFIIQTSESDKEILQVKWAFSVKAPKDQSSARVAKGLIGNRLKNSLIDNYFYTAQFSWHSSHKTSEEEMKTFVIYEIHKHLVSCRKHFPKHIQKKMHGLLL
jgi:hypothetical protein